MGEKLNITIIITFIIALVIFFVIAFVLDMQNKEKPQASKLQTEEIIYGDEELGIDPTVDEQLKDYRNIALLGIDAQDYEHEAGHRSDAIIIISTNIKTHDVNLFSVYRDTYIKIDDEHGLDKVNHAYAYGGMNQSLWALNRNLDLNIRESISLSWESVAGVIDEIDGITIELEPSEIAYMNRSLSGKDQLSDSREQTLNGNQAVLYSRIRKDSPEGDKRRNERMKIVLTEALKKAKTMDTDTLMGIMDKIVESSVTNMSRDKMVETLMEISTYDMKDSVGWPYDTEGWMHNSIYYGKPITLESNVVELHENMFAQDNYDPTDFVKKVSSDIENES